MVGIDLFWIIISMPLMVMIIPALVLASREGKVWGRVVVVTSPPFSPLPYEVPMWTKEDEWEHINDALRIVFFSTTEPIISRLETEAETKKSCPLFEADFIQDVSGCPEYSNGEDMRIHLLVKQVSLNSLRFT